ncbi:MAG: acyltransferase [Proteobacteria bacterium]|nr:acyltransferase [Pseudomonadota bacterium]
MTSKLKESNKFDDIRPYRDDEIPAVMKRLARNALLVSTVRMMKWPKCPERLTKIANFPIRLILALKLSKIKTVDEFQQKIVGGFLLKWVLSNSTDGLSGSGLEDLSADKAYIFVSNHRDIVLDSAFLNYLLNIDDHKVPFIAFGDNLLINDFISDLIRVNKAFTVKRDLPPRKQLKALVHLSEYITHIRRQGNHFWIAQREGRAKDGIDVTNPAIIKMFYLSERKKQPDFAAFIKDCNIVPVAISYEKDPCDRMKGWELYRKSKKGEHKKRKHEDLFSMAAGITGDKGRVHVAFGRPLEAEFRDEKEVAQALDRAIHRLYRLWPLNYIAFDLIDAKNKYADKYTEKEKDEFLSRYEGLNPKVKRVVFETYANPVFSCEALSDDGD